MDRAIDICPGRSSGLFAPAHWGGERAQESGGEWVSRVGAKE
ncbi:MAG: hypothetical protein RBU30_00740 [Polyangia bacterium]|nr:hypothetical protein [Polyangia bacterium]